MPKWQYIYEMVMSVNYGFFLKNILLHISYVAPYNNTPFLQLDNDLSLVSSRIYQLYCNIKYTGGPRTHRRLAIVMDTLHCMLEDIKGID